MRGAPEEPFLVLRLPSFGAHSQHPSIWAPARACLARVLTPLVLNARLLRQREASPHAESIVTAAVVRREPLARFLGDCSRAAWIGRACVSKTVTVTITDLVKGVR